MSLREHRPLIEYLASVITGVILVLIIDVYDLSSWLIIPAFLVPQGIVFWRHRKIVFRKKDE